MADDPNAMYAALNDLRAENARLHARFAETARQLNELRALLEEMSEDLVDQAMRMRDKADESVGLSAAVLARAIEVEDQARIVDAKRVHDAAMETSQAAHMMFAYLHSVMHSQGDVTKSPRR